MRAGRLRHRVTIQKVTRTNAADGSPVDTWSALDTVSAEVKTVSGTERWANERTMQEYDIAVRIRHRADIGAGMRLLYGARVFDIKAPLDPDERRRELVLLCREVKNSG